MKNDSSLLLLTVLDLHPHRGQDDTHYLPSLECWCAGTTARVLFAAAIVAPIV